MKETVFLTGGTGLLGSYILRRLLYRNHSNEVEVIALSRGRTQKDAERRVLETLRKISSSNSKSGRKINPLLKVVRGDITEKRLGLTEWAYNSLTTKVSSIYHSAALAEFNMPLPFIRGVNVGGTKNVLDFALDCQINGRFKRAHHISTIAVAGNKKGIFYENQLDLGQKFNNTYEQTKFETEKLVTRYRNKGLPITVYRPAIIVGDSKTGYTNNLKMFYQPLHLFSLGLFKEIPADKDTIYSFVPADHTADAIIRISLSSDVGKNSTYHITNPNMARLDYIIDTASRYFGFQKPRFVQKREICVKKFSQLQHSLLDPFIPYFYYRMRFDARNTNAILKGSGFKWPKVDESFLKKLYKFCARCGFIKSKRKK